MFNFKRLISKYTKTKPAVKTIMTEGKYDYDNGGAWIDGDIAYIEFAGAVLPISEKTHYDNASYTSDDMKLYTYAGIENNKIIKYKGRQYTTMEFKDYTEHDPDLKIFILKAGGVND